MTQERYALQLIAEALGPGIKTSEVSGLNVEFGIRALCKLGWSDERIQRAAQEIMKQR
jgi:hypothetical protein